MVVLNFSATDQAVDVPCPVNGRWDDLLTPGDTFPSTDFRLPAVAVGSHWGRLLRHAG